VNLSQEIEANVTLTLHGDPKGQHEEGAVLVQKAQDVPVLCAVSALPEELILEIGELGVNESLSLGDVPLPEGVKLNADPETVAVVISVVAEEPVEEEAAEVGAEEGPEVIGEGDGEGAEEGGDEESSGGDGSEGEGKEG
jgi:large subunit ribosomal protein L25